MGFKELKCGQTVHGIDFIYARLKHKYVLISLLSNISLYSIRWRKHCPLFPPFQQTRKEIIAFENTRTGSFLKVGMFRNRDEPCLRACFPLRQQYPRPTPWQWPRVSCLADGTWQPAHFSLYDRTFLLIVMLSRPTPWRDVCVQAVSFFTCCCTNRGVG